MSFLGLCSSVYEALPRLQERRGVGQLMQLSTETPSKRTKKMDTTKFLRTVSFQENFFYVDSLKRTFYSRILICPDC